MIKTIIILSVILCNTCMLTAQVKDIDDLLNLDIEELMQVNVVCASKSMQSVSDLPATIKIISKETIKANAYFTLEDVLADLPGFQFRNISGFNSYSFLRGITGQNNHILLLVDGIQINELNSGGYYGGGQYNLDNIERIEVIYGPASVLYGTNAISGIINIITKSAIDNVGTDINVEYGSFNTISGNLAYNYYDNDNKFGFSLFGMFKTSEKADLAAKSGDNNWTGEMENFEDDYCFDARVQYGNYQFGFLFQNKQSSRTTNYKTIDDIYKDQGSLWNIRFINTYLKHRAQINKDNLLSSQIYFRDATILDNTIAYIDTNSQTGYYRPNTLVGIETVLNSQLLSDLKLTSGLLFETESLSNEFSITKSASSESKPRRPDSPDMNNNFLLSLFSQLRYTLIDDLNIIGGVRIDHSTVYDNVLTPGAGLVYRLDALTFKTSYSEAFRAPKPWDYTNGIGNEDLKPEEISSFELSASWKYTKEISISASYYYNTLDKILTSETSDIGTKWINAGEVTTDGLELDFEYRGNILFSYLNYTYNFSSDEEGRVIPEISIHGANAGVGWNILDELRFILRCNYYGPKDNPVIIESTGDNLIDETLVFHTVLSWQPMYNFYIFIICNNIFDEEYYHSSNRPPDRYRQAQRSIRCKISWQID